MNILAGPSGQSRRRGRCLRTLRECRSPARLMFWWDQCFSTVYFFCFFDQTFYLFQFQQCLLLCQWMLWEQTARPSVAVHVRTKSGDRRSQKKMAANWLTQSLGIIQALHTIYISCKGPLSSSISIYPKFDDLGAQNGEQ